jgi:hypothetical protein
MDKSLEALLNVLNEERARQQERQRAMEWERERQERQTRMFELYTKLIIEPMLDQNRAQRISDLPFVLPLPPRGQA